MKRIVAPCGIICNDCPAYIATALNDYTRLEEIAQLWSNDDNKYVAKDILCDGCSSSRLHSFCQNCEVRECARQNGNQVCSHCALYPCDRLLNLWSSFKSFSVEELRATLNALKA
ncbi:MAG: DUF3795 domain-containing protein [Candidatus Hodarchaeota archaeon]